MTQSDKDPLIDVDLLLRQARDMPSEVPRGLTERVMEDAQRLQPVPARPRRKKGGLADWIAALGGWPALGGLAAASCVGFWIGISPPAGIPDPSLLIFESSDASYDDAVEISGFGWDVLEG